MAKLSDIEHLIFDLYEIIKDYKSNIYQNLFTSISDTFYRENYHSDILCYLFNFDIAKEELIKWINEKKGLSIDFEKYNGGDVVREKKFRDITLYSRDNQNAIIIENKSNNANDQEKQIFRYVKSIEFENASVDGILYINKFSKEVPEHSNWKDEYNEIKDKLLITNLIGDESLEMLIERILRNSKTDSKLNTIATEIINLFKIITMGSMNKEISEMYEMICKSQVKDKFLKIFESLNQFPKMFTNKYIDEVKALKEKYEVGKIDIWSEETRSVIFIHFIKLEIKLSIDIEFYDLYYDISIIKQNHKDTKTNDEGIIIIKNNTKSWPFGNEIVNNGFTKRYRTSRKSAFDKDTLINDIRKVLDAFDLQKK